MSFSKDEKQAKKFLGNSNNDTVTIFFILEECKEENYSVTNLDIESLSDFKTEREVLMLPLTCFEVYKIGEEEMYNNVKYRKIYLNYLDKYYEKIISKIDELREKKINDENNKEIEEFFTKSMNSKFGKDVQICYEKKHKLSTNYCKILRASPDNNFFLSV